MRIVLTYGTFDLFHVGHVRLLQRLAGLGDHLMVGISTDEFNEMKGKKSIHSFEQRSEIVGSLKMVDGVFPENNWEQKREDIIRCSASVFGIGDDWKGKFDHLQDICEVVYLPRTEGVSSTQIKGVLKALDGSHVQELKAALDTISSIVSQLD